MAHPLNAKATLFRSFHAEGELLVLPNAWDACSAVVMERAGATAVGSTSAGVSWSLGRPDGQRLTRDEMVAAVGRIAGAVDIPVTADIEAGYGPTAQDVARTVTEVARAGAVGVNLEDAPGPDGARLIAPPAQAERIAAARAAAAEAGVPDLVINARTDVYMAQVGEPDERFDLVLERAKAYAEAGADVLFVPLLLDPGTLSRLVAEAPLPISVMAWPGGPTVADLRATGVRRISVGTALAQVAYTAADRATRELLTEGTYESGVGALNVFELNTFPRFSSDQ
ncbi:MULTISPECIES: isocitrate lyase/phosphoenolpyruvate mutase family protein [unclassified Streptomyces]|uniref:isocitrate lyase/PEP mutase family protein n=1 Tax=unclassified Streptomyces TaxID=2593676 RepID=UPI00190A1085|nr:MULTISPECIES: isocitrate lyase/phosphoenolpyruvate mutase family protein [unclassified Streptomyces]MBK3569934.1 isocitrate lyase/phosphoenolpyruvate mutase family protein [Streptomyces sp. MBT62]MBK6016244.1 isocitrate lyase/phosphoenolpyruvate mutase family protein [Streptomyces sp. MBT53]